MERELFDVYESTPRAHYRHMVVAMRDEEIANLKRYASPFSMALFNEETALNWIASKWTVIFHLARKGEY